MFSPDGRWIAFMSNKSGRPEVYVRSYPAAGEWTISSGSGGARFPTWSQKRNELFYTTFQGEIMMAPYSTDGQAFIPGKPQRWGKDRFQTASTMRRFDLHPDGERLLVARALQQQGSTKQDKVVFVFNFFEELKRLVPTK